MLDWIKRKQALARENAAKEAEVRNSLSSLKARITERFPTHVLYRVPQDAIDYFASQGVRTPMVQEDNFEWWKSLLENFPNAPAHDEDRELRERYFWQCITRIYTNVGTDGKPRLNPKQHIMDDFEKNEKRIFRNYYASTGIVIKTVAEELVRVTMDAKRALDANKWRKGGVSHEVNRTLEAQEHVVRTVMPQHMEKWSGWYFFHIQEEFRRQIEAEVNYGPQSATSPTSHPAHDDLLYKPNT